MTRKRTVKITRTITVMCDPRLKVVARAEADRRGVPLSELAAQALAVYLNAPELGIVPRMVIGRPRKPAMSDEESAAWRELAEAAAKVREICFDEKVVLE